MNRSVMNRKNIINDISKALTEIEENIRVAIEDIEGFKSALAVRRLEEVINQIREV